MKLRKGKHTVEVKRDDEGNLPVKYYNYVKAGWQIVKPKSKPKTTR